MSGDIEIGTCFKCSAKGAVNRKYYYYPIKCDCCGFKEDNHFEIVFHCSKCNPEPPKEINYQQSIDKIEQGRGIKDVIEKLNAALKDEGYKQSWVANIAMSYVDADKSYRMKNNKTGKYLNRHDRHTIANNAANLFLDLLAK